MITKQLILAGSVTMILTVGTAQAGPCNTTGTSANLGNAGAGPLSGDTGPTTGTRRSAANEHTATSTMNRATGEVATSSQDAGKQMEGRPTAAQQAEDAEPSAKMTDKDQPTASKQIQSPEPSEKMTDQGC
jgi:hypothetical protein